MKAETAIIKINDRIKLHVVLVPEDDGDVKFLKEALESCNDFKVSVRLEESEVEKS